MIISLGVRKRIVESLWTWAEELHMIFRLIEVNNSEKNSGASWAIGLIVINSNSGRLHEKHTGGTWNLGTFSKFPWRQKKTRKTYAEIDGRRTFRIPASSPATGKYERSTEVSLISVLLRYWCRECNSLVIVNMDWLWNGWEKNNFSLMVSFLKKNNSFIPLT